MGALKFITAVNGVQCVMTAGKLMMPMWCVVSLVSPAHLLLLRAHIMAKGLIQSGWMMSHAMVERLHCLIVVIVAGDHTTAVIGRMQV